MTNLIAPHGGYQNLKSFQNAEIVYDLTVEFCRRFMINKKNRTDGTNKTKMTYRSNLSYRTNDQMIQAARSGTRNISEGSQTSGTSKQSELRLLDVARASLQELLDDYRAFLRQNNLPQWDKNDPRVLAIRQLVYRSDRSNRTNRTDRTDRVDETDKIDRTDRTYGSYTSDRSDKTYMSYLTDAESAANCLICLINQTNYLLDQQIKSLGQDLVKRGDFKERYNQARKKEILGLNEDLDFDEFLKQQGLRRLANGRVVGLNDPDED